MDPQQHLHPTFRKEYPQMPKCILSPSMHLLNHDDAPDYTQGTCVLQDYNKYPYRTGR
jgi:hypothetical protein